MRVIIKRNPKTEKWHIYDTDGHVEKENGFASQAGAVMRAIKEYSEIRLYDARGREFLHIYSEHS